MEYCCERFRAVVEGRTSTSPIALAYAAAGLCQSDDGQVVQADNGTWSVTGCCGGQCDVLTEMRFCPFCGKAIAPPPAERAPNS
jgi:hypothetical protein